jgi:transmembrane sensor
LEKVTAWQRGQLIFDDATLQEAVTDFNRYGSKAIVLGDADLAKVRVSGVFRIGDPTSFALAMASTYQLGMSDDGKTIVLSSAQTTQRK